MKRALVGDAAARGLDAGLTEIIERFMNLTDEGKPDGSIGRHMLLFHIRLMKSLCPQLMNGHEPIPDKQIVNISIDMDFNKASVFDYYREQLPRLKANGLLGDPNHEFKDLILGFREIIMRINPGETITYEPGFKSFKEFVEEVV